uniref:Uncharacterized protein n=1 Tax=Caudovirales sp. ctrNG92 TaxID=2827638 RepID=A0A8S5SE87_9CAUD|nr:MAG TPA: hypothetical protein [Caudovirales sp. ctrNG92]
MWREAGKHLNRHRIIPGCQTSIGSLRVCRHDYSSRTFVVRQVLLCPYIPVQCDRKPG